MHCDALRDLVAFVQFKKREKINTPPWVFFTFLNCSNATKSRNASHLGKSEFEANLLLDFESTHDEKYYQQSKRNIYCLGLSRRFQKC